MKQLIDTNLRKSFKRFYELLMTATHYIIDIVIDELLYWITTTYIIEDVWPEDVQPENNDTRQQIHTTGQIHKTCQIHTTATTNSSFFNAMSMLLRLFKYVCPLICISHI